MTATIFTGDRTVLPHIHKYFWMARRAAPVTGNPARIDNNGFWTGFGLGALC